MADDPASRLLRSNTVAIPAVLVMPGEDAAAALGGLISDPVRIPVRIEGAASAPAQAETADPGPVPSAGFAPSRKRVR